MTLRIAHADAPDALELERAALVGVDYTLACAASSAPADILTAAREADVLWVYSAPIARDIIDGLENCKAIIVYGIGYDHVNVEAATERGILVVNLPGYAIEEVSNHALLFLLACAKKLALLDRRVRGGRWPLGAERAQVTAPAVNVYGQTLGLLGFGNIARRVAVKAQCFDLNVCAYDPLVAEEVFVAHHVTRVSLTVLLEQSDFLSLHIPLLPDTFHLLDDVKLRTMKPTAYVINTSRGGVIDQSALVRALEGKWIAGAALDVFEQEPLDTASPLLAMDNVILTPHTAWVSDGARERMRRLVGEETARVARHELPTAIVNRTVLGNSRLDSWRHS
jgi:D-3-phosphoglycerate dehydrogenase